MSGEFTPVDTDNDVTLIDGIVAEGAIQVRDGDLNLNLHEYNGRGVVLAFLPDTGDDTTIDAEWSLAIDATGGTFALGVNVDGAGAQNTAAIAFDADAAAIQAAIVALSNVAVGDVVVTGTGPFTIAFADALAGADVVVTANSASLTGNSHTATVTELVTAAAAGDEARARFVARDVVGTYPDVS